MENQMSHWLNPPLVDAPSAKDRNYIVKYKISEEFFEKNAYIYRRTPIFQMWTHVVGELPPINNIFHLLKTDVSPTISTLKDSVACFKGVRRPYDGEVDGHSILVYIINPKVSVSYEPSMVCLAKAVRVPTNVVATVQVRLTDALQNGDKNVCGIVTRIEFVAGDKGTPLLPEGHQERYGERLR
jgi:hypothetical protein